MDRVRESSIYLPTARRLNSVTVERGFTLIEMVMVVLLIGVIGGLAAVRFESIGMWQKKESLRSFASLWETLFNEAIAAQSGFQLVIDLDNQTYYGLQEIPNRGEDITTQVDYLKNLRIKSDQSNRKNKSLEEARKNLEEELGDAEKLDSGDLETQYYAAAFADPFQSSRTTPPLDFPSLAEPKEFATGLIVRDVKILNEAQTDETAIIRFSPQGSSTFAIVHFDVEGQDTPFTLIMNPATGRVSTLPSYVDYEWSLGKKSQ